MPRYEGTTVSDASCDFVRLFQAAFENFLTRAGYIFWLGQAKGLWLNPNWFHLNGLNHSHCCPAVQLSGGDTPSLGMTGVFTGSHLDLIITYDSSPGKFDRNTFVAYLVPVDSWFHLFFNHWTSGYSGKTQFFFPLENFASKFPRLFLAAPEKPAVTLVAEPAAGVDLEHSLFGFGQRCAILKPFFWRRHFLWICFGSYNVVPPR